MPSSTRSSARRLERPPRRGSRERLADALEVAAARAGVTGRAAMGMLVVVALVLAVLGVRVVATQRRAVPEPIGPAVVTAAAPTGGATTRAASSAPPTPPSSAPTASGTPSALVVHVVGQVHHPGVVHLAAGARVQQAVTAAGGALRGADLSAINLARLVVDGEQVVVPKPGQQPVVAPSAPAPGGTSSGTASPVVDLNTASVAELDSLPGLGPVLAQRIVDWRAENGRFSTVEELGEVSGIGDAVLGRLRSRVTV